MDIFNLTEEEFKKLVLSATDKLNTIDNEIKQLTNQKQHIEGMLECVKSFNKFEIPIPTEIIFSREKTVQIIAKEKKGIQVNDILKEYEKLGYKTHGRAIFRQLEILIKDGLVRQLNPDAVRHKKYVIVKKRSNSN